MKLPWTKSEPKRYSLPVRLGIVGDRPFIEIEEGTTAAEVEFIRAWWELLAGGTGRALAVDQHPAPPRSLRPMGPDWSR